LEGAESEAKNIMIDPLVKKNRWLLAGGLTEFIYGFGEIFDTLYLLLLQVHLLPNFYPAWNFSEISDLMRAQPVALFPVFAFFSAGRLVASIGVLRNRLWGFWLSIFISLVTATWAVFFLPWGGFDMLGCLFIVLALLLGRLGRKSIVPGKELS
jgi:hypothetical protein